MHGEEVPATDGGPGSSAPLPPTAAEMEMARRAQAEADAAASGIGGAVAPTSELVPPPPVAEYKYEIGGQKFILREPVLGQQGQLTALLKGVSLALGGVTIDFGHIEETINRIVERVGPAKLLAALAEAAPRFFAIILTPDGCTAKEKKLDEVADYLRDNMGVTQQPEVLRDFFALSKTLVTAMIHGFQKK